MYTTLHSFPEPLLNEAYFYCFGETLEQANLHPIDDLDYIVEKMTNQALENMGTANELYRLSKTQRLY